VTKDELRAEIARRIGLLTADERRRKSHAIAATLFATAEWQAARTVMLFAGMPDELDTSPIITGALAEGKRVGLPRCRPGARAMDIVRVTDPAADLAVGAYGIPEPVGDDLIAPVSIDFVLVPGRAFDRAGNRLGRGAAYYDRFLSGPAATALPCAVCFDCQVVPAVPCDAHDVPVRMVVTETETVRVDPRPG